MVIDALTPKELTVYMIGAAIAPSVVILAVLYWKRVPRLDFVVVFGALWLTTGIVLELITPKPLSLFAVVIALAPLVVIGAVINFRRWRHSRSRSNSTQISSRKKSCGWRASPEG
jgi:glucose dehydrogenase